MISKEEFLDKFHDCAEDLQSAVATIEYELSNLDMICCKVPDGLDIWKAIEKKENPELWEMVRSLRSSLDDIGLKDCCPLYEKVGEE
jgi:hypothetical protein